MLSAAKHLAAARDRPFAALRVTPCDCSNGQGLLFTLNLALTFKCGHHHIYREGRYIGGVREVVIRAPLRFAEAPTADRSNLSMCINGQGLFFTIEPCLTSEIVEVLCYKVPHVQFYSTCNALPLFASVKETVYPL